MSFSATSRNIHLCGLLLRADCRTYSRAWRRSELLLSDIFVVVNGALRYKLELEVGEQLDESAELRLEGESVLHAHIVVDNGRVSSTIDLDESISNLNGDLVFGLGGQRSQTYRDTVRKLFKDHKPFSFIPLHSPTSIRLLKLECSCAAHESCYMIKGSLTEYDLMTTPQYVALSYPWGYLYTTPGYVDNSKSTLPMECNGQSLPIGENLHSAIRYNLLSIDETRDKLNKTRLIQAAEKGLSKQVLSQLHYGANVAAQDKFGETALHYAAENGHLDVVKILIFAGSSLTKLDNLMRTPLDCARQAKRGLWQEVEGFITTILKHNQDQDGFTSLQLHRSKTEYYWIDAICINQADESEKADQVALMDRIFEQARDVIAWLGFDSAIPQQTTSDLLGSAWILEEAWQMGYLTNEALDELLQDPTQGGLNIKGSQLQLIAQSWLNSQNSDAVSTWSTRSILYERTWFERAWIIQEVMVPKRITVVCGMRSIRWETFVFMTCIISWVRRQLSLGQSTWTSDTGSWKESVALYVLHGEAQSERLDQALELARLRRLYQSRGRLSMVEALLLSRRALCKELKDKVFAMTSVTDFVQVEEGSTKPITLDYSLSVETTFARISRTMFEIFGLQTLSLSGLSRHASGGNMPSWIVDMHDASPAQPRGFDQATGTWQVSSRQDRPWRFTSLRELFTTGFRYDFVTQTGETSILTGFNTSRRGLSWLKLLIELLPTYPKHSPLMLLELLQGHQMLSDNDSQFEDSSHYKDFLSWLRYIVIMESCDIRNNLNSTLRAAEGKDSSLSPEDFFDYEYHHYGTTRRPGSMAVACKLFRELGISLPEPPACEINSREDVLYYYSLWAQNVFGAARFVFHNKGGIVPRRKLFRTKEHNKLASGPESVEVGDIVYYIPETTVPYVLRKKGDCKYWLLGEAYIHNAPQEPRDYAGQLKRFFDSEGTEYGEGICIV